MRKRTVNKYELSNLIAERWSPRAFDPQKKIENRTMMSLIEAARWAPSAFNEQPWRFMVGHRGDPTFDKILSTLVEWNQQWAKNASVLVLNIGKKTFTKNGKKNVVFKYDVGQAVAFMLVEAMHHGIISHEMSGFDPEKASEIFKIPADYQPLSVTAFGYYGNSSDLSPELKELEFATRSRKNIDDIAFGKMFGDCFKE